MISGLLKIMLKEKVALITGSGSGIGKTTAIVFANKGAKVVVNDVNAENGNQTVGEIKRNDGDAIFVKADVSKSNECKKMIRAAIKEYGRIDVLFNNAGIAKGVPIHKTTKQEWDKIIDTNLTGVFLASKYAIPWMIKQKKGTIINMASISGLMGSANLAAYCASKGGVISLTKAMACDLGKYNIRVNCICPSHTLTPPVKSTIERLPKPTVEYILSRYPLGRFGSPEDVASVALFLASDESAYMTGSAIVVDGGATSNVISLSEF
jgi:NAD(P)-dependent dehydrogenase (short-subunit alcohol dehydrogenase family)